MSPILFKVFSFALLFCKCVGQDIFWRDYTGVIPEDAIPGGYDVNNLTTYIGQGYVKDRGIIPGVIYPGQQQMTVPSFGTKVIEAYIKILCSSEPDDFRWFPIKADQLHLLTIDKYLVRGGIETDHVVYLGRLAYQGEVISGKVVSGQYEKPGVAPMYFAYRNKEQKVDSYEVLIYDPILRVNPRSRVVAN